MFLIVLIADTVVSTRQYWLLVAVWQTTEKQVNALKGIRMSIGKSHPENCTEIHNQLTSQGTFFGLFPTFT
jgi:hypothetical protein